MVLFDKEKIPKPNSYFANLKHVEKAYLDTTLFALQPDKLTSTQIKLVEGISISNFPTPAQKHAFRLKTILMELHVLGKVALSYRDKAIQKFLALGKEAQSLGIEKIAEGLKYVENLVLGALNSDISHPNTIINQQNFLRLERRVIATLSKNGETGSYLTEYTTKMFKTLFIEMIKECLEQLKPAPCRFTFIGIGSMARKEMSPYSDVEYAILIEKDNKEIRSYFYTLACLLELKVIQMAETPYPLLQNGLRSPVPEGFRMDSGGNTPLNELVSLLNTPAKIASYQAPNYFNEGGFFITVNALRDSCFIYGSEFLFEEYETRVRENLNRVSDIHYPASIRFWKEHGPRIMTEMICPLSNLTQMKKNDFKIKDPNKATFIRYQARYWSLLRTLYEESNMIRKAEETLSVGQSCGCILGNAAAEEFDPDLSSKVFYAQEYLVIKRELYRLPNQFLAMLVLYYGVKQKNYWERCRELVAQGRISQKNGHVLSSIMDDIMKLRFESQLYYEEEKEDFYFVDTDSHQKKLRANPDQLKRIKRIYQLLYPLHLVLSLFVKSRIEPSLLNKYDLYQPHSFFDEGMTYIAEGNLDVAIQAFRNELALDPDHEDAMQLLRKSLISFKRQNEISRKLNERVEFYKNKYQDIEELWKKNNIPVDGLLRQCGPHLNLKQNTIVDFQKSPFCYLCAFIDLGIDHPAPYVIPFWDALKKILHRAFPSELNVEWSSRLIEKFYIREKNNLFIDSSKRTHKDYLWVMGLVQLVIDRISIDHPSYPSAEILFFFGAHFFQCEDKTRARTFLNLSLEKINSVEPGKHAKLLIKIYDGLSRIVLSSARDYMRKALETAKQISYAVQIIEKRQRVIENLFKPGNRDEELNDIFLGEPLEIIENLMAAGSYLTALPYLEKKLAEDPHNKETQMGIKAIKVIELVQQQIGPQIPKLIQEFSPFKDFDQSVTVYIPEHLLKEENKHFESLGLRAPARFRMAYFFDQLACLERVYQPNHDDTDFAKGVSKIIIGFCNKELQNLLSSFKDGFPASILFNIYFNLGNLSLEWDCTEYAENFYKNALSVQEHLSKDFRTVQIYRLLGAIYDTSDRVMEAKGYYQLALKEIEILGPGDGEELFLLYDSLGRLAYQESNFKHAILYFGECIKICVEYKLDSTSNMEMVKKFKKLISKLLAGNLWDETLIIIEKAKPYISQEAEEACVELINAASVAEQNVLLPYLQRLVQLTAEYENRKLHEFVDKLKNILHK